MHRTLTCASLLLCAVIVSSCSDDTNLTTPTEPTIPTLVTVEFSGTLTVNGAQTHPFITEGGNLTATLTSLGPDPSLGIGLSLGTWNGSACQIIIANTNAIQGTVVNGIASQSGNLCVFVNDVGKLTAPASYLVTVVHP
jgi:hypothetical protein